MCWGGWGFGGGIIMFVWIILIVLAIYWIVKSVGKSNTEKQQIEQQPETAMDILKKRYARGEISKEEFEERKRDLM